MPFPVLVAFLRLGQKYDIRRLYDDARKRLFRHFSSTFHYDEECRIEKVWKKLGTLILASWTLRDGRACFQSCLIYSITAVGSIHRRKSRTVQMHGVVLPITFLLKIKRRVWQVFAPYTLRKPIQLIHGYTMTRCILIARHGRSVEQPSTTI